MLEVSRKHFDKFLKKYPTDDIKIRDKDLRTKHNVYIRNIVVNEKRVAYMRNWIRFFIDSERSEFTEQELKEMPEAIRKYKSKPTILII